MLVTNKVRTSKRVEMTEKQSADLIVALTKIQQFIVSNDGVTLKKVEAEVLDDLRESLLHS